MQCCAGAPGFAVLIIMHYIRFALYFGCQASAHRANKVNHSKIIPCWNWPFFWVALALVRITWHVVFLRTRNKRPTVWFRRGADYTRSNLCHRSLDYRDVSPRRLQPVLAGFLAGFQQLWQCFAGRLYAIRSTIDGCKFLLLQLRNSRYFSFLATCQLTVSFSGAGGCGVAHRGGLPARVRCKQC